MNQSNLNELLANAATLPRSTMLLREDGLRCLLLHLKAGEEIPKHQARGAISVHCLQGETSFSAGEETTELQPGRLITLPPGIPHALTARTESLLLVTLSEPPQV